MNWTFINKAAENVTGKSRKDILTIQCSNWGADICDTDRCGVALLRKGQTHSSFTQPGLDMDFGVDVAYLTDRKGEKIGHIEIVSDITELSNAVAKGEKVREYQSLEVEKFSEALDKVSNGQ